ncbi:suppressor of fused domain protein [Chitinophaga sp. 212800010-3]|uniref:suppressor of fused domain protein n=1 Tax=unclassified Chitinophaga TaxID=2619133 RepID=UPI002DEDA107|nr:SUFU domain-containing protein [Chitinophaga sp. 212800010-3]
MTEPEVLIEQPNDRGTLYAIVEQDDRVVYFYLYPSELLASKYSPRPCWLRNLKPAPAGKDHAAMQEGMAPMLEAAYCNHPEGKEPLEKERLSIVWMEEGDGAAVLYDGEILGVIPGWSMYEKEYAVSYAADCIGAGEKDQQMPLGARGTNAMYERVDQAIAFWDDWGEASQTWSVLQDKYIKAYEAVFGPLIQYFAIDGGQWPPMAIGKFEHEGMVYLLTLGVAIRPMPWVELLYNDRAPGFRRMEMGMAFKKSEFTDKQIISLGGVMAGLADRPWKQVTWLGEGHTVANDELPAPFESIIFSSALYNGPTIALPEVYGDKVNLYWLAPVTKLEREFAHRKPNGGYDLLEKMIQHGLNHVFSHREQLPSD